MANSTSSAGLLILFDLDGTLVDSENSIFAAFSAVFSQFGYETPSRKAVRSVIGRSLPMAMEDILGPDAPISSIVEAYKDHFTHMRQQPGYKEALYPDADRILRRLSQHPQLVLGTATGKALRGIRWLVAENQWDGIFKTYQAADTAASKPAPDMVLNACAETDIPPQRTLVIGDSIYDMEMAHVAGAYGVGVTWGYGEAADLTKAGAKVLINQFNELDRIVEQKLSEIARETSHA